MVLEHDAAGRELFMARQPVSGRQLLRRQMAFLVGDDQEDIER